MEYQPTQAAFPQQQPPPPQQQPTAPYYGSLPPQSNPYATQQPYYGPPQPPVPAVGGGGGGRRLLTGLLIGVAASSVLWAAGVFGLPLLTGDSDGRPGVGKYQVIDKLCSSAVLTRLQQLYPEPDSKPSQRAARSSALDYMYCTMDLKKSSSDVGSASLSMYVQLHKAVDATPEFDAQRDFDQQQDYQITEVPGLGDEAYLSYKDDDSDSSFRYISQYIYVRDGGVTYQLGWSQGFSSSSTDTPPTRDDIRERLIADSKATLAKLASGATS
ncbi:hypothetical protein ACIQGZ_14995 [Streptomyces sp. NPDC092296]|uniref:hypothetical protein n=1 Tax=Streptomyces sp. NPDC092296 TaxID=3366012 RepID=UPI0037F2AE35